MAGTNRFENRALKAQVSSFFLSWILWNSQRPSIAQKPRDTASEEQPAAMLHTEPLAEAAKSAASFQCQKQMAISWAGDVSYLWLT